MGEAPTTHNQEVTHSGFSVRRTGFVYPKFCPFYGTKLIYILGAPSAAFPSPYATSRQLRRTDAPTWQTLTNSQCSLLKQQLFAVTWKRYFTSAEAQLCTAEPRAPRGHHLCYVPPWLQHETATGSLGLLSDHPGAEPTCDPMRETSTQD